MSLPLKSRENRLQKPPTPKSGSSVPRRSECIGSTVTSSSAPITQKAIPKVVRRSIPTPVSTTTTTVNKTPDLLHAPKFGVHHQMTNRKPDLTKNLPNIIVEKKTQPIAVKPK